MLDIREGKIMVIESTREPSRRRLTVLEEAGTFIFYLQGYSCTKKYQQFDYRTCGILPCADRVLSCIYEDAILYYIEEEPVLYA